MVADFHHLVEKVCIVSWKALLRLLTSACFKPSYCKLPFTSTCYQSSFLFSPGTGECAQVYTALLEGVRHYIFHKLYVSINRNCMSVCFFNSATCKVKGKLESLKNWERSANECHCFPAAHLLLRGALVLTQVHTPVQNPPYSFR